MLKAIVAALSPGKPDAGTAATAAWADISFTSTKGGSQTTTSTITFTSGGARTITVGHDIAIGSLRVSVGGGTYVTLASGDTFSVTTGQSVTFKYSCFYASETATVTVADAVGTIDTITCAFSYTGPPL